MRRSQAASQPCGCSLNDVKIIIFRGLKNDKGKKRSKTTLMNHIYIPEQWNDFFVMVGGGAAALAGLIFVAMSINHKIIIGNKTHKNRAINMLSGFTAIFMASGLALIGNQYPCALGFEWVLLWLIATAIFIRGYVVAIRSGMSTIGLNAPRLAGGTLCYIAEVIGEYC